MYAGFWDTDVGQILQDVAGGALGAGSAAAGGLLAQIGQQATIQGAQLATGGAALTQAQATRATGQATTAVATATGIPKWAMAAGLLAIGYYFFMKRR